MKTIALSDITIPPGRQRQEFDPDALMELTRSIEDNGLFHAPVLREVPDGFVLVSGERRIRAIQDLWMLGSALVYNKEEIPAGRIPYVTLGDLSELEAEEAELDENLKRRDLSWQELAEAHERLHSLRQRQKSFAKDCVGDQSTPEWTVADTAQELTGRSDGAYHEKVRRELIVAKNLSNPSIKSAKSVDEAFKILKQEENRENNIALAESIGKTFSSDIHQLHNIDCLEWMGGLEPEVDVILTDPPYGMGSDGFGNGAGKMTGIEHHYSDSFWDWQNLMKRWCFLSYRICKLQAHAYVFCDFDRFHQLKILMQEAGWYVFRTPLIHYKPGSGRVPLPDQGPRRQYECILYAIKGKKPVTHIYPDVIATTADEQLYHGAQKPVELFKNLLQRSVQPGNIVLDCFAGTGTIIPAAHYFKCKAIVLEKEKEYFAICVDRIKKLKEGE